MVLALYASDPALSKGRRYTENEDPNRNVFIRDRDRIIHSSAFRRLEYKTQVFVNHEGDLFRTRLTHSLEVAQIARACARNLNIHEDLVEAIALAHDLGHTPFGHAGQDALNDCMRKYAPDEGGFEHNLQSLRVVDELEVRYAQFDGLNLSFETREGILKHCSLKNAQDLGDVGLRFINKTQPSLEAQLANLADEIAYNNHDIDDGVRSGLITIDQLRNLEIFDDHYQLVQWQYPDVKGRRVLLESIRRMINTLIVDLTQNTLKAIQEHNIKNIEDVRNGPMLVGFSSKMREQQNTLKQFLLKNLYRHYQVMRMSLKSARIITELFDAFMSEPRILPEEYQAKDKSMQARLIADYIAGMTDRYAIREHKKVFEV